jgi:glutathione S-transferase
MKLYYAPGSCALAVHIALIEAGLDFDLERVGFAGKRTEGGADYLALNPKGKVPALELDDGSVLTEVAVLLQYVADRTPEKALAPAPGSPARYRLQEWLNFIATELHAPLSPLFSRAMPEEYRLVVRSAVQARFGFLARQLGGGRDWLMGADFTVADIYALVMLGWADTLNFSFSDWPQIGDYHRRLLARPAVRQALEAEGLVAG